MRINTLCFLFVLLALFALPLSCARSASAPDRHDLPVYNFITSEGASLDDLIHKLYGGEYTIVDIRRGEGFATAKQAEGTVPSSAVSASGQVLEGSVLVFYLITDEGRIAKPMVVKSTNKQLDQIILDAMEGWRFSPPTLKGKPVWSTAAQEFEFRVKP